MRNNRKTWTKDNEAFLMTMARKGISFDVMSSALDRNRSSIYQRIKMIKRREEANKSPRDRSEDLSDVIYNVSPEKTPLTSSIIGAQLPLHEWSNDGRKKPKHRIDGADIFKNARPKKATEPVQSEWLTLFTGLAGGALGAVIMHFIL